jgi:hypothetical protein
MYHVTIQFPSMRGRLTDEEKETLGRVASRLASMLQEHGAGAISRVERRAGEPAAMRLSVPTKAFVEEQLTGALGRIDGARGAAVFFEGPDKRSLRAPR